MFLQIALWGIAVFGLMGLLFGVALAAAARKFHVPADPVVEQVRDNLPSANCGACGFAGCQSYAEAVVERGEVAATLCIPGGKSVAENVARLTGKLMGEVEERVVMIRCSGTTAVAKDQAVYDGIGTCSAAVLAYGGPKACKNGCLGLGDCQRICPFDAIHVKGLGIAEVDFQKCTGCGLCVSVCPKNILDLYPRGRRVELSCVAKDKASVVRPTCLVGCTICRKCVSACPAGALTWDGKTILIDHVKCIAYGPSCQEACVEICPTFVLHRPGQIPKIETVAS
jgi:electron transport complex protein RnfB